MPLLAALCFHEGVMLKYLTKWNLASLGFPVLVLFFAMTGLHLPPMLINMAVFFWPSSIFLMALEAQEIAFSQVLYIWSISVVTNMALYTVIGLAVYWVFFRVSESK
jgi:hypothetical protein